MSVTSNIKVGTPASIPNPPAGEATLFVNTSDNNVLYIKFSDGTYLPYSSDNMAECCSCEIAKKMMEDLTCALKSGYITMTEFTTFVTAGVSVKAEETNDGAGNKTCTVTIALPAP